MKRVLAIALMALLAVTLTIPAMAADGDLIFELTSAEVDAFLALPDPEAGTANIRAAGKPLFTKEGSGIKISERSANWNCVDLQPELFADAGKDYTVIVGFKAVSGDLQFQLANTDGPYATLAVSEAAGSATVTYKGKGSEFQSPQRGVRVNTPDGVTDDYIITSIKVYEGDPGSASGPSGSNPKTGVETYLFIALGALIPAGAGAVVFGRKAKA